MLPFILSSSAALFLSLLGTVLVNAFLRARIPFLGAFAGLERSVNPGIAFGVRLPVILQAALTALALIIVFILAWKGRQSRFRQAAFGLIAGGALGNIIDRIPDGLVTDFIQVGTFPVFNVADSCITIGVGLLLVESLRYTPNPYGHQLPRARR
ncbi:MAG: signal peptidase II [Patescibacteria group bacterium]